MSSVNHRRKRGVHWPGFDNTVIGEDWLTDLCRHRKLTREDCLEGGDGGKTSLISFPISFFDPSNISLRLGVLAYTTIAALCVLLTIFFTFILIMGWKTHFQFPIYRIILQLSISYLLLAISEFFTNIPQYLFNFNNSQEVSIIPFLIEQSANYAAILFYTLLTINRLAIFTLKTLKKLFSGNNICVLIVVFWLLAIAASAFTIVYGCKRKFDNKLWLYVDICAPQSTVMIICYEVVFYTFYLLPFLNLVMYIVVGGSIIMSRNRGSVLSSKAEISLLKQSAAIFVLYLIGISLSIAQTFLRFQSSSQVYITTMVIGVMDPLLGVIFVGTFIGTNRTVQKAIKERIPGPVFKFIEKTKEQPTEHLFVKRATQTHDQ